MQTKRGVAANRIERVEYSYPRFDDAAGEEVAVRRRCRPFMGGPPAVIGSVWLSLLCECKIFRRTDLLTDRYKMRAGLEIVFPSLARDANLLVPVPQQISIYY